ncbi:uncharacterized protein LOC106639917 [Copidosoma floridanum]|uniref:uncharacterized protein LOC106639917 n=1 Tax=Copidosoma floridanum TaxID=29053 RepID=UPI0006C97914|nr:uncharacterized protein LOC106639917 [Copidosoma floridanum]
MSEAAVKVFQVELRDLESLLRKRLDFDGLLECSTESLLPPGDNYGSTILKVRAVIKRNKPEKNEEEKEELNLVAKMMPPTDFQRLIFHSSFTFKKETFFYKKLMPAYQQLEREFGVPADEVFDILPEFYGARFNLKSGGGHGDGDDDDEDVLVDDDAVILMQNLKVRGYYMTDRRKGMDLEHARVALKALARFHGLGIAMKHQKPDFFDTMKKRSKCLTIDGVDFEESMAPVLQLFREDPAMSTHQHRLEAAMRQSSATSWAAVPPEPYSTIIQADFWGNNIMFLKDPDTGRVADVKFVDFQNYLFMSPLRELVFFLATGLEAPVMNDAEAFDGLIDFYHEHFVKTLARMKCDPGPFSRERFDAQLRVDAFEEFPHCPFMLKIMTNEVERDAKSSDIRDRMMNTRVNELWLERLRRCVAKYAEKGWLGE